MPSKLLNNISIEANYEVIYDFNLNRYDEVEVSIDLFDKLFPNWQEHDNTKRFVLIRFPGAAKLNEFKIYEINTIDHNSLNLVLFINSTNLIDARNNLTVSCCIVEPVDPKNIPELETLYISVPSTVYSLLKNDTQESLREKFTKNYLKSNVVNQGDLIRLINGEIKLSEPLKQGAVVPNTNFVLIKTERDNEVDLEKESSLDLDLDLSGYLNSAMELSPSDKAFKVRPLSKRFPIDNFPQEWAKEDDELFAFVSTSDLMGINVPVFNGDMMKIVDESNRETLIRIFTFSEPNEFELGVIYLSPILMFNLNFTSSTTIKLQPIPRNDSNVLSTFIPIANNVTISRVVSSITMDKIFQMHFFLNLKYYLNEKFRCVRNGDFIPVRIDTVIAKSMFETNIDEENEIIPIGNPDEIAWFKIVDIEGQGFSTDQFIIDPLKTKLISSGIEYIGLPPNSFYNWYNYLNLPPVFEYNKYNDNEKAFVFAKQLKKIISTSLKSTVSLNTIVLLNSLSRGIGKSTVVKSMACDFGINLIEIDVLELVNAGQELKTVGTLMGKIDKVLNSNPRNSSGSHIIYLKHIECLCVETNANEQNANINNSISLKIIKMLRDYLRDHPRLMIILSCNDYEKLNGNVKLLVKYKIDVNIPNEYERKEIIKFLIKYQLNKNKVGDFVFSIRKDINFGSLAIQSAGLGPLDLISIVNSAKKFAIRRIKTLGKKLDISFHDIVKVGNGGCVILTPEDFVGSINEARDQFSDSIGAPKIPNVKWEDIGGMDMVKGEILDTIDLPLKHPELFNNGLKKRSGILFYGPPGTGKTLLAKAIASNFSLNFFSVKGPELLNMYIGESEANVRKVFQRARDAKPCVIFFDELDSVAPKRGNQGDSGGVMDRIVSQLLAELDGMSSSDGEGVFVVGATNRPDLLDEALLRPGRFDKMLYLGISDTDEKQFKIMEALTRKFKLHDDVNLMDLAKKCAFNLTGADFYALCSDSMLNAMTRISMETDKKVEKYNSELKSEGKDPVSIRWWFENVATDNDSLVVVRMEDFVKAQDNLVPSVSVEELNHYLRVRENFEGGKDQASKLADQLENGSVH